MGIRALISKVAKARTEIPRMAAANTDPGEVKDLVAEAMDEWYGSYSPMYYRRTYGLYEGILDGTNVETNGKQIKVDVDSSCVPDPAHGHYTGEIIYDLDFLQGFHGSPYNFASTPPPKIYEPKLEELADRKMREASDDYFGRG